MRALGSTKYFKRDWNRTSQRIGRSKRFLNYFFKSINTRSVTFRIVGDPTNRRSQADTGIEITGSIYY